MKPIIEDLVSIVTIVLNGEKEIEQTILSVLHQKNVKIEYIVIDGGSKDNTLQITEKYRDRIDVILSEPDNGIYDALNKGILLANGALIGLIHCGDSYSRNAVSLAYQSFVDTNSDIIYGDITTIEEIGNQVFQTIRHANHLALPKRMSIFHPASFITKRCYLEHGMYNINYKIAADYELFLRYFNLGLTFSYIPSNLAFFRLGGISGKNVKRLLKENIQIRKQHLGQLEAIKFKYKKLIQNTFFSARKWMIVNLIGGKNYDKLRIHMISRSNYFH